MSSPQTARSVARKTTDASHDSEPTLTVRDLRRRWKPTKERLAGIPRYQPILIRIHRSTSWLQRVEEIAESSAYYGEGKKWKLDKKRPNNQIATHLKEVHGFVAGPEFLWPVTLPTTGLQSPDNDHQARDSGRPFRQDRRRCHASHPPAETEYEDDVEQDVRQIEQQADEQRLANLLHAE